MPDVVKLQLKPPGSDKWETVWSIEIGKTLAIDKHTFFYPGDTIRFVVERVRTKPKPEKAKS